MVGVISRSQRLELEILDKEWRSLAKQYESVSQQKGTELNAGQKVVLTQQQTNLAQQMNEAERRLRAKQKACLSLEAQGLLRTLETGGRRMEQEALMLYQDSWPVGFPANAAPEALEELLLELEDSPVPANAMYSALLTFVQRLIEQCGQTLGLGDFVSRLEAWARPLVPNLASFRQSQPVSLQQSYDLIVRLMPSQDKYQVSAWLVPEEDTDADLPPEDWGDRSKTFDLEEIPHLIQGWLKRSATTAQETKRVAVHLFLPSGQLHTEIDRWEVDISGMAVPLGVECKTVVVRCDDRLLKLRQDATYLSRWQTRWQQLHNGDQSCAELLTIGDGELNVILKQIYLKLHKAEVIGCHFRQVPQPEVLNQAINLGSPVCLWKRHLLPHRCNEWQSLLQGPIAQLPEAVTLKREQAWEDADPLMHLGSHLTLLWDDPYRLPPDVAVEFTHI